MFSNANIIKEYLFRYQFASKFASGKILDFQINTMSSFNAAKILLENNATEVIRCNYMNNKFKYSKRKFTLKKEIEFLVIDEEEIKSFNKTFDAIISFETIHLQNHIERLAEFIKFLKNDGILIISVYNKKSESNDSELQKLLELGFTHDEFSKILNSQFSNVSLYSQRLLVHQKSIQKILSILKILRKIIGTLLSKLDKNRQFYIKKLQKKAQKINALNYNLTKIPDSDFELISYNKKHNPRYFVAICKMKK